MKKYLILFTWCLVLFFGQNAFSQMKWKTYANARFDYTILYPSDLLLARGEADNGDGQNFSNNAAEMRVFGTNLLLHKTLKNEFAAVIKKSKKVSYKTLGKSFFVVSGVSDGRIFYQKTIARTDGTFLMLYIEYAEDERADYDKITSRIVKSLK